MMKTKVVFPVKTDTNPNVNKYELNRKIAINLSVIHNQRKRLTIRRSDSSSPFMKSNMKAKRASHLTEENLTTVELLHYTDSAMKLQQNAYEAAITTNRAYNVQLLLIFLEAFISFTFNCYYLISVVAQPRGIQTFRSVLCLVVHLVTLVTWYVFVTDGFISYPYLSNINDFWNGVPIFLVLVTKIFVLSITTAFKLPQSESIAYLLQHLIQPFVCVMVTVVGFAMLRRKFYESQRIVNKIIIYAQDTDIRTRFSAFLQQIQINAPDFNIFGFFSLDGSVIFSMISAITTYLIILVQTLGGEKNQSIWPSLNGENSTDHDQRK